MPSTRSDESAQAARTALRPSKMMKADLRISVRQSHTNTQRAQCRSTQQRCAELRVNDERHGNLAIARVDLQRAPGIHQVKRAIDFRSARTHQVECINHQLA